MSNSSAEVGRIESWMVRSKRFCRRAFIVAIAVFTGTALGTFWWPAPGETTLIDAAEQANRTNAFGAIIFLCAFLQLLLACACYWSENQLPSPGNMLVDRRNNWPLNLRVTYCLLLAASNWFGVDIIFVRHVEMVGNHSSYVPLIIPIALLFLGGVFHASGRR
ncbi:MAG: hypothetical protein PHT12_05595 [Patescibacteria group bacterium]|nr:hypothetical protein [Patescibacteria group bacterium]